MLLKKILPKGKKALLNKLFAPIYHWFKGYRYTVVLDACTEFHFEHIKPVIQQLALHSDIEVIVITPSGVSPAKNITFYKTIYDFPFFKTPDIFISTEFERKLPWFNCPSIYFGHGMGPKLNYQGSNKLEECDFVFSPCAPIYDTQLAYLPKDRVIPLGMPILDERTHQREEIFKHFDLDQKKPMIVYAPSWCIDITKISDINEISNFLANQNSFNVIISPHPNLFNPKRCNGNVYFADNQNTDFATNRPGGRFTSLDIVKAADIVISDISSILFEAIALEKVVLFDGNKDIYEYCEALNIYEQLINICYIPNWKNNADNSLIDLLSTDPLKSARAVFIEQYLFNNGKASNAFVAATLKILQKP